MDSRRRLVDAAVELVFEHYAAEIEIRDLYDFLTPGAVAQRAGVSRGLIYHHWGGASDEARLHHDGGEGGGHEGGGDEGRGDEGGAVDRFLAEVATSICRDTTGAADVVDAADLLPDRLSDVLVAFSDFEMDRIRGDGRAALQATQAMTLNDMWPEGEADIVRAKSLALYERLAEKLGREPVPPLHIADVAHAMSAVVEGFALMARLHPDDYDRSFAWLGSEGPPEAVDDSWNLLAVVAESVVLNMTRPIAVPGE
ncbi:MAG: TetR/AcrR family transcriptional regulator [Actinomycetota bacterium]|nr:TetR/AcrR family transcriptional regulator [Actinomycetota bacterium]